MCGIVGYIGPKFVDSVLIVSLERLEYRGYDSAGIGTINNGQLLIRKMVGKIKNLNDSLEEYPLGGHIGIGHTRWATHGEPTDKNAHPHKDCNNKIAVVHNGIIENYYELKIQLINEGHKFESETDTEVIPHLIEKFYNGNLEEAVIKTVKLLKGRFAICVLCEDEPDKIIAVRHGSPLILGVGKNENWIASDIPAILPNTREVIIMDDGEIGVVKSDSIIVKDFNNLIIDKSKKHISVEISELEKGKFPHFMLKEIHEQPYVIRKIINARVTENYELKFDEVTLTKNFLSRVRHIIIQACGTSHHAGLVAKHWFEKFAGIRTEVEISSEYRYRNPILSGDTLMIAISQSGETMDTIAGILSAKSKFIKILSFVNVVTSTLARESDSIINLLAGPEIGVASTKAYISELVSLLLFALYLGELNYTIDKEETIRMVKSIKELPPKIEKIIDNTNEIIKIANNFSNYEHFIFTGRHLNYPTALEGALKLKEISYIHATGYPAGEFKHGPLALIDEKMPVVCINPYSSIYDKALSNIQEIAARKGIIISIATENDKKISEISDYIFYIPYCEEEISPVLSVVPLQLLAYYIAINRGCDVDRPRNLAKSVTVE